jgi:hypothetical protein
MTVVVQERAACAAGVTVGQVPHELEFWHEGRPVGVFETDAAPDAPGRYRYMPYRGPGHYALATALQEGERPYCCCRTPARTIYFRVTGVPAAHVLELDDFSFRVPLPWPAEVPLGELLLRAAKAVAPLGWLYLPREWQTWTTATPAVVLSDAQINELEGEASARDYAAMVDDGKLLSIVVDAQDRLDIDSPEGLVEALVYYVRFDTLLPEVGAPEPPALSAVQLRRDRTFYDTLGPERPGVACRFPGCPCGAIGQSVFCRAHHFEQVMGRPCPFDDP